MVLTRLCVCLEESPTLVNKQTSDNCQQKFCRLVLGLNFTQENKATARFLKAFFCLPSSRPGEAATVSISAELMANSRFQQDGIPLSAVARSITPLSARGWAPRQPSPWRSISMGGVRRQRCCGGCVFPWYW